MTKIRLDVLMVERDLAQDRSLAQRMIMAGEVRVNGQVALQASINVAPSDTLTVDRGPRFVSRGGDKLEAALKAFGVPVAGRVCADVGASTGGFTDCLLQHGAARVYTVEVGAGILDWKLRQDERVVVMESTNARFVERLPSPVSLVTIDASFISLRVLLPVVKGWSASDDAAWPGGFQVIALIKPQFEASKAQAARGRGVVRDPEVHRQVLQEVLGCAQKEGFGIQGLIRSPLVGPKGNAEFLVLLLLGGDSQSDLALWVDACLLAV